MQKYNNIEISLSGVEEWMKKEMKQISAGGANPNVLDSVYADSYGSKMQIMHLSNIALDGASLKVSPFDKSQLKIIEAAIREADLGLSIVSENDGLRVIFPQLTTETRTKYTKVAKEKLEDARIKVRQIRQEAIEEVDKSKDDGEMGEDEHKRNKEDVQKKIDTINKTLEDIYKTKEEAIMKV